MVAISSTFYKQLLHTKVFCSVFPYLYFGFLIFHGKNFGAKVAFKMIVKLTTGVDFINIFRTKKLQSQNVSRKKTFVRKERT
jgi:hypothetical protein